MTRRRLLQTVLGVGAVGAAARFVGAGDTVGKAPTNMFEAAMTPADWQKRHVVQKLARATGTRSSSPHWRTA
jgi:hypothetical protein